LATTLRQLQKSIRFASHLSSCNAAGAVPPAQQPAGAGVVRRSSAPPSQQRAAAPPPSPAAAMAQAVEMVEVRRAPPVPLLLRAAATPMQIASIQFGIMSADEIARASYMQVQSRDFYSPPDRAQTRGGALDARLGAIDKRAYCETCHNLQTDCVGHFGYIKLRLPVFHVGYFKATLQILQMICKGCSRVLLDPETRERYINVMRSPQVSSKSHIRGSLLREVWTRARKVRVCPYCEHLNGTVKKTTILRVVHYPEGNKPPSKKKPDDEDDLIDDDPRRKHDVYHPEYATAVDGNPELRRHIGKAADDLNPQRVLDLFTAISPGDVQLLDMDPDIGRPERLLVSYMPVPPLCIRPTVCADPTVGSTEDDLTMKAAEIVHINNVITQAMERGVTSQNIFENWDLLQHEVARYINSEQPGLPPIQGVSKPLRGISQRLKGKTGRFRGNLSGKRVDFSGRTVISPDPNLNIDQVGVPERVCKILTFPERITPFNINRLRAAVINGPDVYPGANFATVPEHVKKGALPTPGGDGTTKIFLRYGDRKKIAKSLKLGSVVERHLIDGDVVLFNRQPSLHRVSIMSHRVKVSQHRTFRFNECVCNPYNADFDGDEMNLHVPQTEEARAEALGLMSCLVNMVTPRNGEPLIAAIQDFITTSYLVTRKDIMMDRAEFCQAVCMMSSAAGHVQIPPAAIIKPRELWTGKQLFTVLVQAAALSGLAEEERKPGSPARVEALRSINADIPEKSFSLQGVKDVAPQMCPKDGYISFRGGVLISGQVGKKTVGGGSKRSILYVLSRERGPDAAAFAMNWLARFSARWLSSYGFSIGVDDVRPSDALSRRKMNLVQNGYDRCTEFIDEFKRGKLKLRPGCSPAETLEAVVSAELSRIREDGGKACIAELDPRSNAALAMALSGSKGSNINISQMVSCVGQQTVGGNRAPDGFVGRALPHFPVGLKAREPAAKGFVQNSFFSGMTCTEFFFHTMGGREGLVDTAVKTAETGYMQRRLMKALEDLSVQYDSSVRSSDGTMVQVRYGDDGLDPAEMEADDGEPVEFGRCLIDSVSAADDNHGARRDDDDPFLSANELRTVTRGLLTSLTKSLGPTDNEELVRKVGKFLYDIADKQEERGRGAAKRQDRDWTATVNAAHGQRKSQAASFVDRVRRKIRKSTVEPGSAVGAVGAQSIGEPGTQMTLKTFHFAGVASMNITLGVPRIKEIINASKNISTPILTAPLENNRKVEAARIVKGRIEQTLLGEICVFMKEVYRRDWSYLVVKVDTDAIERLQLELSIVEICEAILEHNFAKIKVEPRNCALLPSKHASSRGGSGRRHDGNLIRLFPTSKVERFSSGDPALMRTDDRRKLEESREHYLLQLLKQQLPYVTVAGIKGIERAVINDVGDGVHNLLVEGDDIVRVMGVSGIVGTEVTSNHVMAMEPALGIEAARQTIMNEIQYTMQSHGMSIDARHVKLLADCMTASGTVLGITRFGIQKMRTSTLMLASFEMTVEHLFDAAIHSRRDNIVGVSERIIMGIPIPLGTGRFRLLRGAAPLPRRRGTVVDGGVAAMEVAAA
jgi:DNA-directed RNA polymerase III subunit RPC1